MPIPFSVFPTDFPDKVTQVLSGIRHDEIRFPGGNQTTMFAAYPIYMPYYLLSVKDTKAGTDASVVGVSSLLARTQLRRLVSVPVDGFDDRSYCGQYRAQPRLE